MSDHTITWTHADDTILGAITCSASPGSWCRMECASRECGEWDALHEHGLLDFGKCQASEWIGEAFGLHVEDAFGGLPTSVRNGPVVVHYDEGWVWDYADQPPAVLDEVRAELSRQDVRWGEQNHPDGTGSPLARKLADSARNVCDAAAATGQVTWQHILHEELWEVFAESDPVMLRAELIQVAAVATQWVGALDRRTPGDTA